MRTTLILGAGFSKNSGIPIQSEIPEMLIEPDPANAFENSVTLILQKFLGDVFGYDGCKQVPGLDDIFTCIDISTNSGHHLGIGYSPVHLRTIRRLLVYRVFSILENSFKYSEDVASLIHRLSESKYDTNYIVLNWDTVLEKYIKSLFPRFLINYCNGGHDWKTGKAEDIERCVKVVKTHGSTNWLYCDNCRALFHDFDNSLTPKEKAGFQSIDTVLFKELVNLKYGNEISLDRPCRFCGNSVSSHIATFSYRKSFRANSFPNIWDKAEEVLAAAERWVFIGYSLPEADYEFKHLLKIAQLKLDHKKKDKLKIDIVLLNSNRTIDTYKGFFGNKINRIFNNGIKEYSGYLNE